MKEDDPAIGWEIDPTKCVGWGDCVVICPVKALKLTQKVAIMADPASCCLDLVEKRSLVVVSDEVYDKITFDGMKPRPFFGFLGLKD